LAVGTLASYASWALLIKFCPGSQIFLRCILADLDLIMNAERFARIGQIFDDECNQCYRYKSHCATSVKQVMILTVGGNCA